MDLSLFRHLKKASDSKILMVVLDGLGGMPLKPTGLTELEMANTPHLDALVFRGICGLHQPVGTGITPGSGPGHLALFGYDPLKYPVGSSVLGALGIGFDLKPDDVAARGNFCSVDDRGNITDRRDCGLTRNQPTASIYKVLPGSKPGAILHIILPRPPHPLDCQGIRGKAT